MHDLHTKLVALSFGNPVRVHPTDWRNKLRQNAEKKWSIRCSITRLEEPAAAFKQKMATEEANAYCYDALSRLTQTDAAGESQVGGIVKQVVIAALDLGVVGSIASGSSDSHI